MDYRAKIPTFEIRVCARSMHKQFGQGNYMGKAAYRSRGNIRMALIGDACYVVAAFILVVQYDVLCSCYHVGLFLKKTGICDEFMSTCAYIRQIYTGCHRRNGPNFGRVFLMLNYTDMT